MPPASVETKNSLTSQTPQTWFQARLAEVLEHDDRVIWIAEGCSASRFHLMRYLFNLSIGLMITIFVAYYAVPVILRAHVIPATFGVILLTALAVIFVGIPLMMLARRNRFAYAISEQAVFAANDWPLSPSFARVPTDRICFVRMTGHPDVGTLILFDYTWIAGPFEHLSRLWMPLNMLSGIPDPLRVKTLIGQTCQTR